MSMLAVPLELALPPCTGCFRWHAAPAEISGHASSMHRVSEDFWLSLRHVLVPARPFSLLPSDYDVMEILYFLKSRLSRPPSPKSAERTMASNDPASVRNLACSRRSAGNPTLLSDTTIHIAGNQYGKRARDKTAPLPTVFSCASHLLELVERRRIFLQSQRARQHILIVPPTQIQLASLDGAGRDFSLRLGAGASQPTNQQPSIHWQAHRIAFSIGSNRRKST